MGLEASKPLAAAPRVPPDAAADADDPEPWNMLLRLSLKVRGHHLHALQPAVGHLLTRTAAQPRL